MQVHRYLVRDRILRLKRVVKFEHAVDPWLEHAVPLAGMLTAAFAAVTTIITTHVSVCIHLHVV